MEDAKLTDREKPDHEPKRLLRAAKDGSHELRNKLSEYYPSQQRQEGGGRQAADDTNAAKLATGSTTVPSLAVAVVAMFAQ